MRITGRYDVDDWYCEVTTDGKVLTPARSQRVFNHSPTGFAWGYAGSGPAQLALAILLEHGLEPREALAHYQAFKFEYLAPLPRRSFDITVDLDAWLAARNRQEEP